MAYLPLLLQVQELENRLLALKQAEQKIRQDPELKKAKKELAEIQSQITKLEADKAKNLQEQQRKERDLQTENEHLKAINSKLYDGSVTSSRELEQLQQKEVEYRERIQTSETGLLQFVEADDNFEHELRDGHQLVQALEKQYRQIYRRLKEELGAILIEQTQLQGELEDLSVQIPENWLNRYRKMASGHNGIAISRMKGDSCGACHVSQSEYTVQKVKRGDDQIITCENCGRLLYY